MHGLLGQQWVAFCTGHAQGALGQAVKTLVRGLAQQQVAGQVFAKLGEGAQHIFIAPVARVAAKLQRGMGLGKGGPHKALRAHVFQKPGQAVVARAWATHFIDPVAATRHGHQLRKQADLPGRVYLHDLNGTAHARHGVRQQVTL